MHRYLARYAQPEAAAAADLDTGHHANVLVIPCYDEASDFLDDLLPTGVRDLLVIVVVNAPDNSPADARGRTLNLLETLRAGSASLPLAVVPFSQASNVHLLVIDRVTGDRLIPRRQGVGLARKIGADCALALLAAGRIHSKWIHATDADVSLPDDYLDAPRPGSGTVLFPFRHTSPDAALQQRANLYELHLGYYVNRLASAGSPYAFHTLGSAMAMHGQAYAKVRGYPRRNAGEDFYLLNKLAKVDPIHRLAAPEIVIHARRSQRVPFGTGPALANIPDRPEAYLSYAAASFELLREVLHGMAGVVAGGSWSASRSTDAVLAELGFFEALQAAQRQQRRPDTLRKALHQWFDGFRTLRFIHECRRFHEDEPLLATLARVLGPAPAQARDSLQHYLDRLHSAERRAVPNATGATGLQNVTRVMSNSSH
jgi:hypothetical protein